MISLRGLRRKVRSVRSIQQITRAMKMVSSIRLKHARDKVAVAQPFTEKMRELLGGAYGRCKADPGFADKVPVLFPLLAPGPASNAPVLVVVTSDRGLCGGYNATIIRRALDFIKNAQCRDIKVIAVGKKGRNALVHRNVPLLREHLNILQTLNYATAAKISNELLRIYREERPSEVLVVHSAFKSVVSQPVVIERILPITESQLPAEKKRVDYLVEPESDVLLAELLPYFFRTEVYRILLESLAAEHAARMLAMDGATTNADAVIKSLTRNVNRLRQERITQELSELISGEL